MGRTGVLSAGFFYKRITGFIYDREFVYAGPVAEFRGYYGIQPANGGTGHVTGAEFDYSQRLASLPGALAGLGFDVNWTHTESSAQLLSDTASTAAGLGHPVARTVKLPRQSPDIANVAPSTTAADGPPAPRGSTRGRTSRPTATVRARRTATRTSTPTRRSMPR